MRNEARLRGIHMVSVNVNNIASDGVPFIHLANAENIETEGLHERGKESYSGGYSSLNLNLQFSEI